MSIRIFVKLRETVLLHKDVSLLVEEVEKRLSKFIEKDEFPKALIGFKIEGITT